MSKAASKGHSFVKIDRAAYDTGHTNWVSGQLDERYSFEAKVFAGISVHGIPTPRFPGGGNVSKLCVRDEGREVWGWDRGPVCGETVPHYAEAAAEIVAALEAEFCAV